MIEIDNNTGCLREWIVPGTGSLNFIGSGCELSDWFSFFSHERYGGVGVAVRKIEINKYSDGVMSKWDVETRKGSFRVEVIIEETSPNVLMQRVLITAKPGKDVSWIGDAVVRFVVPDAQGFFSVVEGYCYEHKASNVMRETEDKAVKLQMQDGRYLNFRWARGFPKHPVALTPYLYIRDQYASPNSKHEHCSVPAWVLHGRLLTEMPSSFVFRFGRNPAVLWNSSDVGKMLFRMFSLDKYWRTREFQSHDRMQTQGLWPLQAGEKVELSVELELIAP